MSETFDKLSVVGGYPKKLPSHFWGLATPGCSIFFPDLSRPPLLILYDRDSECIFSSRNTWLASLLAQLL